MSYPKFVIIAILISSCSALAGNETNDSFSQAKKHLRNIYADHRITIYCGAEFNADNTINLPKGFIATKYKNRMNRIEWEHVVPAENFGRTFPEWRDGHPKCIDNKGNPFKGRNCAEKVNYEYRLMQADMYNLFPAIGSVNAMRSNYNFTQLPENTPNTFGSCAMKIEDKKVEPPLEARGVIARTYFYMEQEYSRFKISKQMKQLLTVWDKQHPVTEWECIRAERIEKIQGNPNDVVNKRCQEAGY